MVDGQETAFRGVDSKADARHPSAGGREAINTGIRKFRANDKDCSNHRA